LKAKIPFPNQTAPGAKVQEGGGRIVNGYVEELGDQAPNKTVIRRVPGMVNFGTSARTGYRGAILVNSVLYAAFNGKTGEMDFGGRRFGQCRQSERHKARVLRGEQQHDAGQVLCRS
jgi:hypothetical protein